MRLSIIIVTFNSQEHVQSCLDAVFRQGDEGVEVIVVDNGSKDATLRILKENYRQVRLIENSGNEGACRARNQGIAAGVVMARAASNVAPNSIGGHSPRKASTQEIR